MRALRSRLVGAWPWILLALAALPAFWYGTVFSDEVDPEFPRLARPTFSSHPPFAYRLAEPGDTIDHVAVYVASAALVLAASGWYTDRGNRAWGAALALSAAAFWHAATPGPLLDGWHGLGWRAMLDHPHAPASLKLGLAGLAAALAAAVVLGMRGHSARQWWKLAGQSGTRGLFIAAALLLGLRQLPWLGPEPAAYWSRWMYVWALLAWASALVRLTAAALAWRDESSASSLPEQAARGSSMSCAPPKLILPPLTRGGTGGSRIAPLHGALGVALDPPWPPLIKGGRPGALRNKTAGNSLVARSLSFNSLGPAWRRRFAVPALLLAWMLLAFTGRGLFWYQRPLARLRAVVPGRVYISAMPTYRGLELAQKRHHFRTIINLFPEYTAQRNPRLPEEIRFAREHTLRYVANPAGDPTGEAFIARTIALAQDPSCWPILVHCHACMDRTPAWMGIYRFVVQGWPLADALREIEHHRGMRPWASVTLLYNRVLPHLAPTRWALDPAAAVLQKCAAGTVGPVHQIAARGMFSAPCRLDSK
jgi:hypothetical protein